MGIYQLPALSTVSLLSSSALAYPDLDDLDRQAPHLLLRAESATWRRGITRLLGGSRFAHRCPTDPALSRGGRHRVCSLAPRSSRRQLQPHTDTSCRRLLH